MGKLYLIPCTLGEYDPALVLPGSVLGLLRRLRVFVVEELRSARRFLSVAGHKGHIGDLDLHELNEHSSEEDVAGLLQLFSEDVGLLSEAGLPAVADPGALLVALCHKHGIQVVPLVGPSSLMLALMASGLNGQSFTFLGYLPAKSDERRSAIKAAEKRSTSDGQTQIFIETPYRNDVMFADCLATLRPSTRLCIAADLTLPTELILTRSVASWKRHPLQIGKRPCVFLILA